MGVVMKYGALLPASLPVALAEMDRARVLLQLLAATAVAEASDAAAAAER
jgi:hypothetical protein